MKHLALIFLMTLAVLPGISLAQPDGCNEQKIRIHVPPGTQDILVTPPVFNQKKGCGIEFFVPAGHTTSILSSESWLTGTASGGSIIIQVPGDAAPGDYKYDVKVEGVGLLDPVIRVI